MHLEGKIPLTVFIGWFLAGKDFLLSGPLVDEIISGIPLKQGWNLVTWLLLCPSRLAVVGSVTRGLGGHRPYLVSGKMELPPISWSAGLILGQRSQLDPQIASLLPDAWTDVTSARSLIGLPSDPWTGCWAVKAGLGLCLSGAGLKTRGPLQGLQL